MDDKNIHSFFWGFGKCTTFHDSFCFWSSVKSFKDEGRREIPKLGPTHLPRNLFTLSFACHKFRLVPRRSLFIIPYVCPLGHRGHWRFLARGVEPSWEFQIQRPYSGRSLTKICLFREKEVSEYIPSNQKYHPYNFMNVVSSSCFLPIHSFIFIHIVLKKFHEIPNLRTLD
jgi:hypothetical protein